MRFLFLAVLISINLCDASNLHLEELVKGADMPVAVEVAPGEKRLYVVEQAGRIRVWEAGAWQAKPFLDIRSRVTSGGERGLLGLAFHPNYQKNKKYYVNYTTEEVGKLRTIVSEFVGKQERRLLRFTQPYANHNGGQLAFGPDGYLYIGVGDGGWAGDPKGAGQNPKTLLGKILRIDVNKGNPYGVPADNPYVKGAGKPEVFALGMRNPWRFSFDTATGGLFVADVGQNSWEEVNRVERGGNYGWNIKEGKHCFSPARGCSSKGLQEPLWEYPRGEGISVTGGYVYRGAVIPKLQGAYVYGDYGSGRIWALRLDEKQTQAKENELLLKSRLPISSFGQDWNREILVVSHYGSIFRLVAGGE